MNTCANCMFYAQTDDRAEMGSCHRYPRPLTLNIDSLMQEVRVCGALPMVTKYDWCGEYKGDDDVKNK